MSDLLDSLLESTLDDLADLPTFAPYSAGAHQVKASFTMKEINGKGAVELSFVMVENIELAKPDDKVPAQGDTASTMFFLESETGQGFFKEAAKPFQEAFGYKTLRDVIEGVQDIECVIVTGIRKDKRDPDNIKEYLQLKTIAVV